MKKDLITRLNEGPIICAEGYLFAMERRGYEEVSYPQEDLFLKLF